MSGYRISKDDILEATSGGITIFEYYITDVDLEACARTRKKFKLREEATPSATIKKMSDGNYVIADFGADGKWRNAIAYTQHVENLDFGETIRLLATRHGIADTERVNSMYEPKFSTEDALPDQPDKAWYFDYAEEISEAHLRILFSKNVWSYLHGLDDVRNLKSDAERKDAVLSKLREICRKQHWHALNSYTIIKKRKAIKIEAAEYYPIFCIEENVTKGGKDSAFKKIYQPKSKDKGKRFFYHGDFDPQFLHGYNQALQAFQDLQKVSDDSSESGEENKQQKLPEIIHCTGGSDALNMYALGYQVTYGASEYFKLDTEKLKNLFRIADQVMTCPDLDPTGQQQNHQLCMDPENYRYLDISVIELPEQLKARRDQYRRPCKDARDFLNHFRAKDFRNLVKTAKPYRFWDWQVKMNKDEVVVKFGKEVYEYRLSPERILHFLQRNGFCQHQISEDVREFVHIDGNVVRIVEASDIKVFLIEFLRSRYFSEELINLVHKSPSLNESAFQALEVKELNFSDHDRASQYFFFENGVWKADKGGVTVLNPLKIDRRVWESKILKHSPRLLEPMFRIVKHPDGDLDIEILDQSDMFFRFLIQTSRIHWKKELEDNLLELPEEERKKYLQENQFNIAGPNLSPIEQREQKQHLINKIFAIGYMMARYKDPSNPWSVFAMDGKVSDDGLSHGGTGKSIFSKAFTYFKTSVIFDGRDDDLFKDKHAFELVDKRTDYLLFDDASKNFQFNRLFSIITGGLTVNPKGTKRQQLSEEETGKIAVSTNFTPNDIDPSVLRRLLFVEFTDYYHLENNGEYNETRQPKDDFGKNLFREYTPEEWEKTINFMIQCVPVYFNNEKIEPPTGNILKRNLIAVMGVNFFNWAEVYFSEESTRLDCFVPTSVAAEDYVREGGVRGITSQGFKNKIKAFAQLKDLIYNPKELLSKDGRITKYRAGVAYDNRSKNWIHTGKKTTLEYLYLQTMGTKITDIEYDPTLEDDGFPSPDPSAKPIDF